MDDKTEVVNLKEVRFEGNYKRIDRATKYGNPFRIGPDGDREEVIKKFREWWHAPEQRELRERAKEELRGEKLACWCKPKACHGDVIKEFLEEGT